MDLFTDSDNKRLAQVAPLAVRMRPRSLDEFVGQRHFLGEGKLLRRALKADRLMSMLFYGPSGTGKTALAHVIAQATRADFKRVNAAETGVKEIRRLLAQSRAGVIAGSRPAVLFVDEMHRFSKSQQDVLLEDVAQGVVILIGATTENPYFAVNAPLISRSQVFQFEPLSEEDIKTLLERALEDVERGLGSYGAVLSSEAMDYLAAACDGDARRALMALEIAVVSQADVLRENAIGGGKPVSIGLDVVVESIQAKAITYDRAGDAHFDAISAMIKSIRGSDPDAAVYWLARMIVAGEDPMFIARRIVIASAEDIGNADPQALVIAQAAAEATRMIGLPECQLPLSQAVIYLACSLKSRASAEAIWRACEDVREGRTVPVPKQIRSKGAFRSAHEGGQGEPGRTSDVPAGQEYFGIDKKYYFPTDLGTEKQWTDNVARNRAKAKRPGD